MKRFTLALVLLLLAGSLAAQVNSASLTGLVTDPSSAIVEGAKVTATNTATGLEYSADTAGGYYTFATLPVGTYDVKVEKQGFRKAVAKVTLEVGQKGRQDFSLQVGAQSESVTVEGTVPLLSTQDASPGSVVDNNTISGAPLSARNWDDLLGLVPGVQADRYTEQGGGTAAGRTGGVNVHGVRSLQNNFVLDGVDNNSFSENVQELTSQIARPSLDAIQEFKVSTNPYSAENGRSPGSLVSVTTKGGTNNFHGTAFEYLRNKVFDARDFFNARTASQQPVGSLLNKKPAFNQNQFGGAIGGPIIKNKAFFFFNYEGTRIRKGRTYLANVPLANERVGDFSLQAATANGIAATTANPLGYATLVDKVGDCIGAGATFTVATTGMPRDNMIPARCLDASAVKILGLVPGANNIPGAGVKNLNDFANVRNLVDDANNYTGKVDYALNASNNLFVRYTNQHRLRFVPGTFGGILDGTSTSAAGNLRMNAISTSIGWNHIFTPRVVNEFRIGWGRDWSFGAQEPFGLNKTSDYVPNAPDNPLFSGGIPRIAISSRGNTQSNTTQSLSGVDNWGSPDFLPKFQYTNQFQWVDTLNWTLGKHNIRVGADLRAPMRNIYLDVPATRGRLTFDGNRTNVGFADFLLGYPQSAEVATPSRTDARLWMLSEYFQDDWKLTPKLTLNYGLRYDYATWPYSAADRMTNLASPNPAAVNAVGSLICASSGTYCGATSGDRGLVKPDKNNFAPRIGVAYQITPNTVFRTGYGRFYMLFERAGSEDQMFLNPPWLIDKSVAAAVGVAGCTVSANNCTVNNMRLGHNNPAGVAGFNLSVDPANQPANFLQLIRLRAVNPNVVQPEVDQWNAGIERQLPGQIVATLEYVGTKGTHLSILRNLNQPYFDSTGRVCVASGTASPNCPSLGAPGAGVAGFAPLAPYIAYTNLGPIEYRDNVGNSTYHGLEASMQKRLSHGLSFTASYTWSHSIDQAMEHLFGGGSNSFLQNAHDLNQQRGNSDFDIRQRFIFSYVYELPFGKGRSWVQEGPLAEVVGGWRVSSISSFHTGRPFTLFAGNNSSAFQLGGFGATALADCPNGATVSSSVQDLGGAGPYFFDPSLFAVPAAPSATNAANNVARLGNCPRNSMYGPGLANVDFAVARTFRYFGEGRSLEFRWEAFNIANHPYFGLPSNNCNASFPASATAATQICGNFANSTGSATFGRITALQGDPRTMQLSLRFAF